MTSGNRSFQPSEIAELGEVFRRFRGIRAVYLFGSAASERAGPESDIDLAVIPTDPLVREQKLDILEELARQGYCNVDLVFLDNDDLVLAYEGIRHNRLIYAAEGFDRGSTYSEIVRKYLDFEFYLNIQRTAYKRRNTSARA